MRNQIKAENEYSEEEEIYPKTQMKYESSKSINEPNQNSRNFSANFVKKLNFTNIPLPKESNNNQQQISNSNSEQINYTNTKKNNITNKSFESSFHSYKIFSIDININNNKISHEESSSNIINKFNESDFNFPTSIENNHKVEYIKNEKQLINNKRSGDKILLKKLPNNGYMLIND